MAISVSRARHSEFLGRRPEPPVDLRLSRPVADGGDRDYWLAHCEGYRVDGNEGRIGFVEEVSVGAEHPRQTLLAVRAGRLGRRLLLVSAADAAFVVPRERRIWLRTPTVIVGTERARPLIV